MTIMEFHWCLWVFIGADGFSMAFIGFQWQLWVSNGNI